MWLTYDGSQYKKSDRSRNQCAVGYKGRDLIHFSMNYAITEFQTILLLHLYAFKQHAIVFHGISTHCSIRESPCAQGICIY